MGPETNASSSDDPSRESRPDPTEKSDEEWREELSDEQYEILREAGTEPAFSGEFVDHKADGSYACAGCGATLFESDTKFESGCGWPSFYDADDARVKTRTDTSHGMHRTEVLCANCDGHLGHVFEDGPEPTGKRFCINSAALEFEDE